MPHLNDIISILVLGIIIGYLIGFYGHSQKQTQQQQQCYDSSALIQHSSNSINLGNYDVTKSIKTTTEGIFHPLSDNDDSSESSRDAQHICHLVSRDLIDDMMMINGNGRRRANNLEDEYDEYDDDDVTIIPHTSYIWQHYKESILHASRHMNDVNDYYHHFITKLFKFINPSRLAISRKSLPTSQWKQIENILHITYARWLYVHRHNNNRRRRQKQATKEQKDDTDVPRKLSIVVLGGSVTSGSKCLYTPIVNSPPPPMTEDECSWPSRLQYFLNQLLLGNNKDDVDHDPDDDDDDMNIVEVYNIAFGTTNTIDGQVIWDLSLLPNDVPRHPDIIINAYSTSDINLIIQQEHDGTSIPIDDVLLNIQQNFIRLVLSPDHKNNNNHCTNTKSSELVPPPLLLFYDDYIGNNEKGILNLFRYGKVMNMLSNYYGIGYISYADSVRSDLVYPNTKETWFSSTLWPLKKMNPGQGMHITSTWMITYNILDYITTHCSSIMNNEKEQQIEVDNNNDKMKVVSSIQDDIEYKYKDMPKTRPIGVLPPILQFNLTLDNISKLWDQAIINEYQRQDSNNNKTFDDNNSSLLLCPKQQKSCYYACYSMILNITQFNNTLNQYMIYNNGWNALYNSYKVGYVPVGINSTFVMLFTNVTQRVHAIHVIYLQYNGDNDSLVEMTSTIIPASGKDQQHLLPTNVAPTTNANSEQQQQQLLMSGYHDKNTAGIYHDKLNLMKVLDVGNDIQIQFQFINGRAFKLLGIALCDH